MDSNDDKCSPESLKAGILHLRALREKLCSQQTSWDVGFKVRDYVVDELQLMQKDLLDDHDVPSWCAKRIECILNSLCVGVDNDGGSNG